MVLDQPSVIRVLLVEDNPGDARLVEILLSDLDLETSFDVTQVARLNEALELLSETEFSVVLLDLSLPDSSGLETVERMQATVPHVPVVVLSGRDDEEVALQALQSGAEDYLVKGQGDGDLIARSIRYSIQRKQAEERLAFLSQYDHLTGLANRALFRDRLRQAFARASEDGEMVALIFLDLDGFKAVNDSLGQARGDELLQVMSARLQGYVGDSDTVARLSGDEFAVVLENVSDARELAPVVQELLDRLSTPLVLGGQEIAMTSSAGITVHPPSEEHDMLRDADAAVQRAKRRGRGVYEFYTAEMNAQAHERLALENGLRRALERNEFLLHYQPQVDLKSGQVIGAEALLRWQRPDAGLVSPEEFIPVLEDTGLIVPVGEWVLRTACKQSRAWRESGLPPIRVAVNISARQFTEGLGETVVRVLEEIGMDPRYLELEITESLLMEDTRASSSTLEDLRSAVNGLRVAIDDFGTGYSSLAYLKAFPIDLLKIDRSFIQDMKPGSDDAAITSAIIGLAHSLRLEVIAEGVETGEQLDYLLQDGCDQAQGFYFSRPVPAGKFFEFVSRR